MVRAATCGWIAAVVLAAPCGWALSFVSTPGWEYGRRNCGPVSSPAVSTRTACLACCQAAADNFQLTPAQLASCQSYCHAVFQPRPAPSRWIELLAGQ